MRVMSKPRRKNPAAVALGSLGGKASGKVRKLRISPERLSQIGRIAAGARWAKRDEEQRAGTPGTILEPTGDARSAPSGGRVRRVADQVDARRGTTRSGRKGK